MSSLYFDETLSETELEVGASVTLRGEEAHHAVNVSRLRVGEQVQIGNGAGTLASAVVVATTPKTLTCEIQSVTTRRPEQPALVLVQSLAKGDRDERAVESSTEVGVDRIYPYQAHRSVSRWSAEKALKGQQRWQKLAREAAKQSLRHTIPEVGELLLLDALTAIGRENTLLVLEPTATHQLSELSSETLRTNADIVLLVGPEGGLDDAELNMLGESGATFVRLGDTVLRTSTAGVAAISVLNAKLGRW